MAESDEKARCACRVCKVSEALGVDDNPTVEKCEAALFTLIVVLGNLLVHADNAFIMGVFEQVLRTRTQSTESRRRIDDPSGLRTMEVKGHG